MAKKKNYQRLELVIDMKMVSIGAGQFEFTMTGRNSNGTEVVIHAKMADWWIKHFCEQSVNLVEKRYEQAKTLRNSILQYNHRLQELKAV